MELKTLLDCGAIQSNSGHKNTQIWSNYSPSRGDGHAYFFFGAFFFLGAFFLRADAGRGLRNGPELLRRLEATGAHRVRVQEAEPQAG